MIRRAVFALSLILGLAAFLSACSAVNTNQPVLSELKPPAMAAQSPCEQCRYELKEELQRAILTRSVLELQQACLGTATTGDEMVECIVSINPFQPPSQIYLVVREASESVSKESADQTTCQECPQQLSYLKTTLDTAENHWNQLLECLDERKDAAAYEECMKNLPDIEKPGE